jgi:hypothetical protein
LALRLCPHGADHRRASAGPDGQITAYRVDLKITFIVH